MAQTTVLSALRMFELIDEQYGRDANRVALELSQTEAVVETLLALRADRSRTFSGYIGRVRDAGMKRFWDERARENAYFFVDNRLRYENPDLDSFWARAEADLDLALGEIGVTIDPSCTLVEIGCGVGRLTRVLARRAERVIALDVSKEMLARAREHNPELSNVEWLLGDGTSLTAVPDGVADACLSMLVFQHIPDPEITLGYVREIGRVLKPGGWAAIQFSNDPTIHRPHRRIDRVRRGVMALLGRAPGGQDHPAWLGSAVDLDDARRAAQAAGLRVEAVSRAGELFCSLRMVKTASGPPTVARSLDIDPA